VESVLQCVGVDFDDTLTHSLPNHVFFKHFQKYIQNHVKHTIKRGLQQGLLQSSPTEVDYTMNDYYKGLLLEYLL